MLLNKTANPFVRPAKNPREKVRADERLGVVPKVTTPTGHPFRLEENQSGDKFGRTGERKSQPCKLNIPARWIC